MKTKLLLSLILTAALLWSCEKEKAQEITQPDGKVSFSLMTSEIFNMLDVETLGHIDASSGALHYGIQTIEIQNEALSKEAYTIEEGAIAEFYDNYPPVLEEDTEEEWEISKEIRPPVLPEIVRRPFLSCASADCESLLVEESRRLQTIADTHGLRMLAGIICCDNGQPRLMNLYISPKKRKAKMEIQPNSDEIKK